jgi:hypothetical protein
VDELRLFASKIAAYIYLDETSLMQFTLNMTCIRSYSLSSSENIVAMVLSGVWARSSFVFLSRESLIQFEYFFTRKPGYDAQIEDPEKFN